MIIKRIFDAIREFGKPIFIPKKPFYYIITEPQKINEDIHCLDCDLSYKNDHAVYLFDEYIFDEYIYAFISNLDDKELAKFAKLFTDHEQMELPKLVNSLFRKNTLDSFTICDKYIIDYIDYTKIITRYKHPKFFKLLSYLKVNKNYDLCKENHGFNYHFHLYDNKKQDRTATLLTFCKDEKPNTSRDEGYREFDHKLFYERHSEGSHKNSFVDVNSLNKKLRGNIKRVCKGCLGQTEKIHFRMPSPNAEEVNGH